MKFTKDSGLVRVWVNLIKNGYRKLEEVPNIFNLKEVVREIIEKGDK
ncbi:MAG: CD1375 family protein [Peptoniphilus harei]|nr:CD1375 family protein [Peptoniphilus harei]